MAKDLYAVLGLSRNASAEDIKKAYRKMSKEWHPDKHKGDKQAEEKFKEINEAYEVLSDQQKKQAYDQFGSTNGQAGFGGGQGGGFNAQGFDFSGFGNASDLGDMFESFFGGGRGRAARQQGGHDREIELTIDFAEVVTGAQKVVRIERMVECATCNGDGAEPGTEIAQCPTCHGTGQITQTMQSFFGNVQRQTICGTCEGSGKVPKTPCSTCKGEGRVRETSEVIIEVPAGIEHGQTLKLRGQADAGRQKSPAGDLYVHIRVRSDKKFTREGADIRTTISVPAIDAILGAEAEVQTVHGMSTLQIPDGMQPGQTFRIRGKGLPILGSSKMGDHYVKVEVEIPKKLSRAERKLMEEWRQTRG